MAKGRKTLRFPIEDALDWAEVEGVALGRSGNLQASVARVGKRVLVGWSDDARASFFGG